MRFVSCFWVACSMCALTRAADADLPSVPPIYGEPSLESVGASLEQSVSEHGQNDSREEAERRLRENGDAMSLVIGSVATSFGASLLASGIALTTSANWEGADCPACMPSIALIMGGAQLTIVGLVSFIDYHGQHVGRGHRRRVDALVRAMANPSYEAARAARRGRLAVGWSFVLSGIAMLGGSVALFAMGHQNGFDDDLREGLAAANAFAAGWLTTIGSAELSAKWNAELALAPAHGGAMFTYERRW